MFGINARCNTRLEKILEKLKSEKKNEHKRRVYQKVVVVRHRFQLVDAIKRRTNNDSSVERDGN